MHQRRLRIATWNCNGALRRKWPALERFDADVLTIQECEDPARSADAAYRAWAGDYLWTGADKNKGLGVFARKGVQLASVDLDPSPLELFLPCLLNDAPFLAVWTKEAKSPTFKYIGQFWKFIESHGDFLRHPLAVAAGDFNSNVQWDVWDRWWNHSDVVRELEARGLRSLYHHHQSLPQGGEPHPTFFLHRKPEKPYHIDYVFAAQAWRIEGLEIGAADEWLALSDHMPILAAVGK